MTDAITGDATSGDETVAVLGMRVPSLSGVASRTSNVTVTAVPADRLTPTEADAIINQDAMLPAPGTVIYIQDSNSAVTDGTFTTAGPTPGPGVAAAARYVCTGSRLRKTNTSFSVIEMDLVQYDSYDVSVAIT